MAMSMPYVALYPTDFLADVTHLGNTELGIYTRLLLTYYRDGRPLANDMDRIRRMAMTFSPEECKALNDVLAEFFTLCTEPDGRMVWRNKRADLEIERANERHSANMQRTRKATEARARKQTDVAEEITSRSTSRESLRTTNQNQNQNLEPENLKPKNQNITPAQDTYEGERAPPRTPLVALVCLLREHGADVLPSNPQMQEWIDLRVTEEQALRALYEAKRCREKQANSAPIKAAYLTQILKSQMAQAARPETPRERLDRERSETLDILTGRKSAASERGRVIDITPNVFGMDRQAVWAL